MNKLIYIALLFPFAAAVPAFGQDEGRFEVKKDTRKIELPEATRNFEKITLEPPQAPVQRQEYSAEDVDINLPKLTTKINVVKMPDDPLKKLYGNYVKAGFGNYGTPYLEGYFNNKRSEKYAYGLHLKHFSSQNGPVKYSNVNSGLSQNQVDGYWKYFGKNYVFTSGINYNRNRNNFYGFERGRDFSKDSLKHVMNTFNISAGIRSSTSSAPLVYNLDFNYFLFNDNRKASEGEFLTNGGFKYKIDKEKAFQTDMTLSISKRSDINSIGRNFFQLKPALVLSKDKYTVTGGLNFAYTNDTISKTKVHVYPRVHLDYAVADAFTLFGGIDGEMQKNTLRGFMAQNPFLGSNVPLAHTNKALEIYGGGKGNIKGLNYKAKISYGNYKNLYLFNNSFTDTSKFTLLYDKSTNVLNLEGDLGYEVAESFRVGLNMNYYSYNTTTYAQAYQRPNFVARVSGTYNLYKKIYFNADIFYISGLTGKNFISNREVKLKNIADVNLKVDYRFSNVFSAFLEVNNLLSQKYQRYLYYPVKGINVIGGITYSF